MTNLTLTVGPLTINNTIIIKGDKDSYYEITENTCTRQDVFSYKGETHKSRMCIGVHDIQAIIDAGYNPQISSMWLSDHLEFNYHCAIDNMVDTGDEIVLKDTTEKFVSIKDILNTAMKIESVW